MKLKKILPVLLLVAMVVITFLIRRCNGTGFNHPNIQKRQTERQTRSTPNATAPSENKGGLDRTATKLFFTKHAKCRMKCRHITQKEVKEILLNGTVNYNKSDLQNPKGPTYAVEGVTSDRQHVRIIFAPKQQHLTVVTVIDLEEEYKCSCA